MVGKYVQIRDSYISLNEALMHGGLKTRTRVKVHYIESTDIEKPTVSAALAGMDAILVPGGFGERGIEGKIQAVRYAREHGMPYLGICLGMQLAIIEYGRHVLKLADAHSTEFNRATAHRGHRADHRVAGPGARRQQTRDEGSALGGTMRLGAQEVLLQAGSLARELYGRDADRGAPSAPLRVQQQLSGRLSRARACGSRASRRTGWSRSSSCRAIPGSWLRSSTPSSPRPRATVIRCSRDSCAPRAPTAPRSCRPRPAHEAGWLRGRDSTGRCS